jgi:hypothetical protein
MNILDAMEDARYFKGLFKDQATWTNWKLFLKSLFNIPLINESEKQSLEKFTGLKNLSGRRIKEAFIIAGRRSGKSWMSAIIACYLALFKDWRKYLNKGEQGYIFIISVDKNQARIIKQYISGILHSNPSFERAIISETAEKIELSNNITIMIKTASYRSIRGFTVCAAILDEIAFFRSEDSANPDKEILTALRPCLSTIPESILIAISTPYGRSGVLYDQYKKYYGIPGDTLIWKAPTELMNPTILTDVIEKEMANDPAAARAEWLAEWREDIESFLSFELIQGAVVQGRGQIPWSEGIQYTCFIDPSGGRQDSFTLGIAHYGKNGKSIIDVLLETKSPFKPDSVVYEYSDVLKNYKISRIYSDRYAEPWVSSYFEKEGIILENSGMNTNEMYLNFLPLLTSSSVELPENERLKSQLQSLERKARSQGKDQIGHPPGVHDDLAVACAGACVMAKKNGNYIRDVFQFDELICEESLEDQLVRESIDWLLDRNPIKKDDENIEDNDELENDSTWIITKGW